MAKISSKTLSIIQKHLDDAIDGVVNKLLPKIIAAPITFLDNILEKKGLNYLNDNFGPKIPDSLNPTLDELAVQLDAENWPAAQELIAKGLADEINTPGINGTPEEQAAYSYVVGWMFNALKAKVTVKMAAVDPALPGGPVVK